MSEKEVVVSAPMSFQGSLARSRNWFWHDKPTWFKAVFGWGLIVGVLGMWWPIIVAWYIIFGLLLAPYRLIRRGSRRRKAEAKKHKELLEALNRRG
jgi:Flp pilus assembly protein TadB